jgi:hypothetical protein
MFASVQTNHRSIGMMQSHRSWSREVSVNRSDCRPEVLFLSTQPQWWGYSKEHGWVVLDRELDCNTPGMQGSLLFLRCRDSKVFQLKRDLWRLPAYQFAPNYVRSLADEAGESAAADLEALMSRWPELRDSLHGQYNAMLAEKREAERLARQAEGLPEPGSKPRRSTARSKAAKTASDAGGK